MLGKTDWNKQLAFIVIFCAVMSLLISSLVAEENADVLTWPDSGNRLQSLLLDASTFGESMVTSDGFQRYAISVRSFVWYDFARRRSVPVVIYSPSVSSSSPQTFPVIVFSHGLGGSSDRCSYLGSAWSARGFIVVLLQHSGMDESIWKGKLRPLNELRDSYQRYWSGRTQAMDIRFALDRLEQLNNEDGVYRGRLDVERIGVGGYDLGALASLLVAGQAPPDGGVSLHDERVQAVIAMSPPVHRGRSGFRDTYEDVTVPVFFITGTEDDGIVGSTKAYQRRIPFDFMSDNNRYLITFEGADHQVYGGHIRSRRARNDNVFQSAISRVSSCFWLAHLRDAPYWRNVVDGYGLNALIGNMGRVERRVHADEPSNKPTPQEERMTVSKPVLSEPMLKTEGVMNNETRILPAPLQADLEGKPIFPLTRYYRSIVVKYDTGYALEPRTDTTLTGVAARPRSDVEGQ